MPYYPVLLDMRNKLAVVIGAGEVALRKVKDLAEAGARVRVVAPTVHAEIEGMAAGNTESIEIVRRAYRPGDLEGAVLVFSAAGDPAVNRSVFDEALERGIFINAVDDPPNCSFIVPSFVKKGDLLLAVSTGGASPAMAARLRRSLEECLPADIDAVLDALREARRVLQGDERFSKLDFASRGEIMKKIVNSDELLSGLKHAYCDKKLAEFLTSLE
jgi:siroheme synthase-like protein